MFARSHFRRLSSARSTISRVLAGVVLAALAGGTASAQTYLVNTGPGSSSIIGAPSLFSFGSIYQYLGVRFTLGTGATVGTIEGWMARPAGTINVKIYDNNGSNKPGTQLYTGAFAGSGTATPGWAVFSGINFALSAGTYWVTFEPTGGNGSMPNGAANPQPSHAFLANDSGGWQLQGASAGLRISTPAPPAPINVPADQPTIQDAIDAASLPGQEIVVAPGTYVENISFGGKTIIVRSSGGAAVTIIDGDGNDGAVQIVSGSASGTRLEGFTITGGSTAFEGGGVWVGGATALIKDCVIDGNIADSGGGVAAEGGANATFQNCVISANSADTLGGGAYVNGATATFTDCDFDGNDTGSDGGGLDVNNNGNVTLTNTNFSGNSAGNAAGGAMIIGSGATASFTNCTFSDNTALQAGGVMANAAVSASFNNCDFINNHATIVGATGGGGLQAQGTIAVTLTGCDFQDNDAAYGGGVQFLAYSGTATISGCSFSGNVASISGGGYYRGFGGSGSPAIGNTTFCGNAPDHLVGTYTNNRGNHFNASCTASGGDLNGDGHVNVGDLLAVIGSWGACPAAPASCLGDTNNDGQINVADLLLVIANWG